MKLADKQQDKKLREDLVEITEEYIMWSQAEEDVSFTNFWRYKLKSSENQL